ncbi:hypothetical protein QTN47_05325 [Danxiaibacter flavus]|uniref:Uncharacterized protein n=1 Tax=Danxiaibacter flavus TaxID=3049108 RepID=A0ABV3ZAM6_9BACT|nr:hypothetical protein QNM32_05325 [Chitinophagaceae bacterium DXS]
MMFRKVLLFALILFSAYSSFAQQDTSFVFKAENLGQNRIRVSWQNPYGDALVQINVQRSYDSLRNFRTVFSTPSPELPENGFIDPSNLNGRMYYRIFYVLNGGAYYFTKPKRSGMGFVEQQADDKMAMNKNVTIQVRDKVYAVVPYEKYKQFKDSIVYQTQDSLFFINDSTIMVRPYVSRGEVFVPSRYIFTNKEGNIYINIPDATNNKYKIVFFDDSFHELFTIHHLAQSDLTLDKANFLHSGWFYFELYENDRLKEKNKFYLQREF